MLLPSLSFAEHSHRNSSRKELLHSREMKKADKFIRKIDKGYEITARNGVKIILKNRYDSATESELALYARYRFQKFFKRIGYLSFQVNRWESSDNLMINVNSGKQFKITNNPHISPNKKRLVSVAPFTAEMGGPDQSITIYKITSTGLEIEWEFTPGKHGLSSEQYKFHSWNGNNKIKLNINEYATSQSMTSDDHKISASLISLTNDKWDISDVRRKSWNSKSRK